MARLSIFSLAATLTVLPETAAARPDTRQMTCAQANALVKERGAVVMTTGRHTYRRFVAHQGFCDRWEITMPDYAPTRDNPRCVINGVCREPPWEGLFD
jgi:hypothetical protein